MFEKIKRGGVALASALLAVGALGFAQPALATEDANAATSLDQAHLTKVIAGPENIDASGDTYTFHFAGGGSVAAGTGDDADKLFSDGVEQNTVAEGSGNTTPATIKAGDVVPTIADLTLKGVKLDSDHAKTSGQVSQAAVTASFNWILGYSDGDADPTSKANDASNVNQRTQVIFPHAGVYTYEVTESTLSQDATKSDGVYINKSNAKYLMRVNVINDPNTPGKTKVESVTVEKKVTDEGGTPKGKNSGKVDSTYPQTDDTNKTKIVQETSEKTINDGDIAGDARGREVYGFSFANEYVKGGQLVVKKSVQGNYGDKTKAFPVTLTIIDSAAPEGSCVTYVVTGGTDKTSEKYTNSEKGELVHQINGVQGNTDKCVEFEGDGKPVTICADLKDGDTITITGLYGIYKVADDDHAAVAVDGHYRTKLTDGLKATTQYKVEEAGTANYSPCAFVYSTASPDPTTLTALTADSVGESNRFAPSGEAKGASITVDNTSDDTNAKTVVGNDGGYVYLINTFDDSSVSPTGIFIDNLPYILMIGIPVVVFAGMFANKRRSSADLAA